MRKEQIFTGITSQGGLLPADFLAALSNPKSGIDGLDPVTFRLAPGERLGEQVNRSWNRLKGCWANFQRALASKEPGDPTTSETRERWLLPLFQELDFGRLSAAKPLELDGRTYSVSHGWGPVPIHLVGSHVELDRRTPGAVGAAKASPHSLVQQVLNASDDHLWGIISNGFIFRLLRDNLALTRQAYVEWDLQAIFDGDLYPEFFLLWVVCHQSRFEVPPGGRPEQCRLEKWRKQAEDKGLRALENLRPGVEQAIAALGEGFVSHKANQVLREKLRSGALSTQDFYRQILRVIYRILFLLVTEDRELLHPPLPRGDSEKDRMEAAIKARQRYDEYYSVGRLRNLSLRRAGTPHPDLWQVLQFVTNKLGSKIDCPELALPALGSFLWSSTFTTDLNECQVSNNQFLKTVHALAFTHENNLRRTVDYKNLGSEELGSVYESLLELHPIINAETGEFELQTADGHERKTSGSYYTPDSLVQSLLDSALEPIMDKVTRAKEGAHAADALLQLKICDPAVGSGHFLIAAAHRIAKRVATFRTGETEPSPEAIRAALREVIGRCLYGVDINPMATELCKVNLWLEALEPGKPLSFLDHHLRVGNSLIGSNSELVANGIPDEAFSPIDGDDKEVSKAWKKRNKDERDKKLKRLFDTPGADIDPLVSELAKVAEIVDKMPDAELNDIEVKREGFERLLASAEYHKEKLLADSWCAAFFWRKTNNFQYGVTTEVIREISGHPETIKEWMFEEINRLAKQYQFFHWQLAFPEVFAKGGFDCVLGNPPWGANISGEAHEIMRFLYSGSKQGILDTFALFVELSTNLVRSCGTIGLVLPDIILLKNYPGIRHCLLMRTAIIELAHWGQAFKQVNIDVCSLVAARSSPSDDHLISCIPEIFEGKPRLSNINMIPQRTFLSTKQYRFNLKLSAELQDHLDSAKSLGPTMGELFTIREGVHSGNVRSKLFLSNPEGNRCEPLIFGRDEISPMTLKWEGKYIQLDPSSFKREDGDYFNLGDPNLHRSPKILVRRTGDYILAAIDEKGMFCSNNFFLCVPKPGVSWEMTLFTCAVLNSRFATWFFRAIQPRTGKLFAELKITHLEDIPVPFIFNSWASSLGKSINNWLVTPSTISANILQFNQELEYYISEINKSLANIIRGDQ